MSLAKGAKIAGEPQGGPAFFGVLVSLGTGRSGCGRDWAEAIPRRRECGPPSRATKTAARAGPGTQAEPTIDHTIRR